MAVQIGLGLITAQVPPGSGRTFPEEYRLQLDLVREAEVLGFDSVWVSEHHGSGDGYLPSLLPMLAAFAAVTEHVTLGTGVILTPLHDPLQLAEDASVVDNLSNGRLILGLGLGWREEEFRMFGVTEHKVARHLETVEILRKAFTGERFTHRGKAYTYEDVLVMPPPARPGGPPIYLGGFEEKVIRRAGALGDGYIRSRSSLESAKEALRWAEDDAREVGKDPEELGFALLQNAFAWEEGDAWKVVRDGVAHHLGTYAGWGQGGDTPGRGFEIAPPPDEVLQQTTPHGTPAQVVRQLRPLVDAFADRKEYHLIVRLAYPGMDDETARRAVEVFGSEVLPALKGE